MANPRTSEDGVPRSTLPPEKIVVRGSRGKSNPTISEGALRKGVNQNLSKTVGPKTPGPFKAKGPLDEIIVRGKKIDLSKYSTRMLKGLLTSRGFTNISNAYLGQYIYNTFFRQMEQLENEQLQQDAEAYAEIEDAVITGTPHTGMEEVIVTAPKQGAGALGRYLYPGPITALSKTQLMRIQDYFREHVHVTAPRITRAGNVLREIEYTWTWINRIQPTPFTQIRPREAPPRFDNQPVGNPYKDIGPRPEPFPRIDPSKIQNIYGRIDLKITPRGLRLATRTNPRTARSRREENKRRRDKKFRGAAKVYRRVLRFVSATYGAYDELTEVYEAITWNMTIDGKPLVHYQNPKQALMYAARTGHWEVDWESLMADLAYMQAQDKIIGKASQMGRYGLNEMGYYGPNPGSYLPPGP